MQGRLPEFLGIGVQKGGTTTLQRLLEQHPEVYLPPRKELHYFSLHYGKGETWYREQFAEAVEHQRCGEITPYYVFHPEALARIHDLLPNAKLILLLRDPVERALSQFFHSQRLGLEPLDLESALAAEPKRLQDAESVLRHHSGVDRSHQEHSYLARSRYDHQLQRIRSLFSTEQVFVRRSEDFFGDQSRIWRQLLEFLELSLVTLPTKGRFAYRGGDHRDGIPADVMNRMRAQLRVQLEPTYAWLSEIYDLSW